MKRIYSVLSTILLLSGALYVYCILIVPVLEPPSQYVLRDSDTKWNSEELQRLKRLFPVGSWELEKPRHIAIDNIHLFVKDYKITEKGEIKVDCCSMVIVNNDSALRINDRYDRSIVIRCSGETTLRFEQSLIKQGLGGSNQLRGGTLNGEIHIYCKGDPNTKEDDLDIKTRDINIDADRAWTRANIKFSYGRAHGVGSGLQIQFISKKMFNSFSQDNNGIVGRGRTFDKLSLQNLQSLTFYLPKTEKKYEPGGFNDPNIPITMQCKGIFTFSALNKCATFSDQVILTRSVPGKKPETLHCDLLKLQFVKTNETNVDLSKNEISNETNEPDNLENSTVDSEWNLTPSYIEALGKTVTLYVPEHNIKVLTSRIMIQLSSEIKCEIDSANTKQSYIQYNNHELHTSNLIYKVVENNPVGYLKCISNGWFRTKLDSQQNSLRARWEDNLEMTVDPKDKTEHVLVLKGRASLEFKKNSQSEAKITSDSIYLWLKRTQNETSFQEQSEQLFGNGLNLLPERMNALKNVEISSIPLTAKLDELQLWFVQNPAQNNSGVLETQQPSQNNIGQGFNFLSNDSNSNAYSSVHYNVSGEQLLANVIANDNGYELSKLLLDKNIEIAVENVSDKDSPKLKMTGNTIEIHNVTQPIASANLIGQPAHIQYGDMSMTGLSVNVNRGTNRIWIDSPGEAEFLSTFAFDENQVANNSTPIDDTDPSQSNLIPGDDPSTDTLIQTENNQQNKFKSDRKVVTKITWKEKMELEADKIKCSGGVVMDRENVYAQCDTLTVELSKKINLQTTQINNGNQSPEIRNIILSNSVKLENSTYQLNQKVAQDTLFASELKLRMTDKTFIAKGPGRAMTQRMAQPINIPTPFSNSETTLGSSPNVSTDSSNKERLMHLCIDFQNELTGSFNTTKPMTFIFSNRVEGVYGPINQIGDAYENYDMTKKPIEEISLKCDTLEINTELNSLEQSSNLLPPQKKETAVNLPQNFQISTSGNVVLENVMYSINAETISYQAKNHWMKIDGDGQIPAKFFYKKIRNGRFYSISSSTINYYTNTGFVTGEGIQGFTLFLEHNNQHTNNSN